jgi:hypothetical protein
MCALLLALKELEAMLSVFLNRKREVAKALDASRGAVRSAGEAIELTRRVYGIRLLVRGLLWIAVYLIARGLLELDGLSPPVRAGIAVLPIPFFAWWLWTWMKGVGEMDELERRIELEALAFAFPLAVVALMTLGLLDVAAALDPDGRSLRHVWLLMPCLYYLGLWRAKRRYQ